MQMNSKPSRPILALYFQPPDFNKLQPLVCSRTVNIFPLPNRKRAARSLANACQLGQLGRLGAASAPLALGRSFACGAGQWSASAA